MKFSNILLISSLLVSANGQSNSPQNENTNENAGATESDTTTEPAEPAEPSTQKGLNEVIETIIIQGSVIREDGSPPPFGTVIERECGPDVTNEILVDGNGYFTFIVGDEYKQGGLPVDASENIYNSMTRNIGSPDASGMYEKTLGIESYHGLFGCVVRAKFNGFRSTEVHLGTVQKTGLIDVGTLVMYPVSRIRGTAVSVTNLKAPTAARKALEKGKEAFEKNELKKAEKYYQSALELYPDYSEAWVELGWLHQKQKRNDEARKDYLKASGADKKYISPYIRLAQLSALEEKWKQSADYSGEVISLDPISYPESYFLHSLSCYEMGQIEKAESTVRQGIKLDVTHQIPKMYLLLSNILALKRDFSGAMDALKQYLRIYPDAPDTEHVRSMIQALEKSIRAEHVIEKKNLK